MMPLCYCTASSHPSPSFQGFNMKIVLIIFVYLRPLLLWYHNIPKIHSITAWQMILTPKVMQLWPLVGCKEKRGRLPKPWQKAFCLNTTDLFYTKLPSKNTTHTPCGCSFLPFIRHGKLLPAETSFCTRVVFSRTLRYPPHSSRVFTELVFQPANRSVPFFFIAHRLFILSNGSRRFTDPISPNYCE